MSRASRREITYLGCGSTPIIVATKIQRGTAASSCRSSQKPTCSQNR